MASRTTTLHALCMRVDPDFLRKSRIVVEYEFSAPGRRSPSDVDGVTYEMGRRIFTGDYQARGPYATEVVVTDGLTFNGTPVLFDGTPVTFDAD